MGRYVNVVLAALLIVTGVLVFLPSGYISAGGNVFNQSFEEGTGGVPSGWNLTGSAARVDTGPIYAGNWSGPDSRGRWCDYPVVVCRKSHPAGDI